jgi:hypothetical protein
MCTSSEVVGRSYSPVQQWAQNIESSCENQERKVLESALVSILKVGFPLEVA